MRCVQWRELQSDIRPWPHRPDQQFEKPNPLLLTSNAIFLGIYRVLIPDIGVVRLNALNEVFSRTLKFFVVSGIPLFCRENSARRTRPPGGHRRQCGVQRGVVCAVGRDNIEMSVNHRVRKVKEQRAVRSWIFHLRVAAAASRGACPGFHARCEIRGTPPAARLRHGGIDAAAAFAG